MKKILRFAILSVLLIATGKFVTYAQNADARYPIIPYPQYLKAGNGSFVITPKTLIITPDANTFKSEAAQLNQMLSKSIGGSLMETIRQLFPKVTPLRHSR
jgi:hexosaminidase